MNWFDRAAVRGTTHVAAACLQSGLVMFLMTLAEAGRELQETVPSPTSLPLTQRQEEAHIEA